MLDGRMGVLLRLLSARRFPRQYVALRRWGTSPTGLFLMAHASVPDRLAIVDDAGGLTYEEVDDRTTALALALLEGRETPPVVAILCRNHRWLVESLIACGKLRTDPLVLDPERPTRDLLAAIEDRGPDVLIADAEFESLLVETPGTFRKLTADGLDDLPGGGRLEFDDGERLKRPGLRTLARELARVPLHAGETVLIDTPISDAWGLMGLRLAFAVRGTAILSRTGDPQATADRYGVTVVFTTRSDLTAPRIAAPAIAAPC